MKKLSLALALILSCSFTANAQFGLSKKHLDAAKKTAQALTVSDAEIAQYCQEYVDWSDKNNPLCETTDKGKKKEIADRLAKIVAQIPQSERKGMDIKAYYVVDQNAFACANGSIRVFAGLMELLTDDEILGIIGHEIGHIVNKDSKGAFKKALLTSALKDAVGSTSGAAAALTESQLGELGEALAGAQFSQKAEYAADDYGYELLKRCGKDAKAMASSLRVIQKLQDDANIDKSKTRQLFSSHPESGKRAEKLDKKYEKENK
ncbi:putative metalloprotease [Dysgonomonas sp. PFB1-18]|uniref:M48 family metalloprotease n=1 Tax=unclassified Dysgonomonas TaxID=2630389 RepID=UPI0024759EA4|nr:MULTISPECIES: M48 family metalloprotease [unclassified Dysgonomonas]MDL2302837.1 M48 family metalloprotease [Dysgonomonas sp. OttesenSCG-928-D17]MDH6309974.1 putative metalloprotease [Dysgonomonas sp. PF1-14]MDH6339883.1 putative metalloprotease [Dysgonomonas sp. PF1-16]MDH6381531.1 putative metalloprotease [Dysgonomonas sp. PFB1-18]MDH6398832.1 putative metalloprotease [Dysgonomonas sp. PF1-23]